MDKENKIQDLAYYLTVFKIAGHETWRTHVGASTGAFMSTLNCNGVKRAPKVTAKRIYRIDRITGEFEEL